MHLQAKSSIWSTLKCSSTMTFFFSVMSGNSRPSKCLITQYCIFSLNYSWQISGGHIDVTCGIIHLDNSAVFDGPGKKRKICTPLIDPRNAGNVRFNFALGKMVV